MFGLTGNFPDYTMLLVGANMGVVGMTKEHFHLTLALKVPSFVVVTKIDIAPQNVLEETMRVRCIGGWIINWNEPLECLLLFNLTMFHRFLRKW